MMSGEPLFPGESDIDQLFQITQLLGPLAPKHRHIVSKNPMFSGLNPPHANQPKTLTSKYSHWSTESLAFLKACLDMDPEKRPSCTMLLKSVLFTHDNFYLTFPAQLQSKLQQEFGSHKKKAPTSGKKHRNEPPRRSRNSEAFDTFFGQDLQAKSTLLTGIYSPSKTRDESKHQRIVAPPPTLTTDMGARTLSSARSEVDSSTSTLRSRVMGFQSPDSRGQRKKMISFECTDSNKLCPYFAVNSPQRLKRYDGFEQGLNHLTAPVAHQPKGAPYKLSDPTSFLRNKSPPLKKTKRKETYPPLHGQVDDGKVDQTRFTLLGNFFYSFKYFFSLLND